MKVYRVGLIGAGFMGRTHAWGYRSLPYFYDSLPFRCELAGITASSLASAERAKDVLGFERAYPDAESLITDPTIDIIDIASPNHLHADAVILANKAGKPIYCDKPLTGNLKSALRIESEVADLDRAGQMVFQNRFFPATMRARQMMESGDLGDIVSFRFAYLHSGNVSPHKPLAWKDREDFGAGVLYDLGSHVVDLLLHLSGREISSIIAKKRTLHTFRTDPTRPTELVEQTADDQTIMLATLDNGAIGTIEASKIATGLQDELRFELHGTRGALRFSLMDPNYLDWFDESDPEVPLGGTSGFKRIHCVQRFEAPAKFPTPRASIGWLRGHLHCLYCFVHAVHSENPFEPSLRQGVKIERILDHVK